MNIHIGKHIIILSKQLRRYFDYIHAPYDLTHQQGRLLGYLKEHKNVYQKDIEKEFHVRRSSVSSFLNTLEKRALIERVEVENDARLKKIVLTQKGEELQEKCFGSIIQLEDELSSLFSEEEKEKLLEYFGRISSYLEEREVKK